MTLNIGEGMFIDDTDEDDSDDDDGSNLGRPDDHDDGEFDHEEPQRRTRVISRRRGPANEGGLTRDDLDPNNNDDDYDAEDDINQWINSELNNKNDGKQTVKDLKRQIEEEAERVRLKEEEEKRKEQEQFWDNNFWKVESKDDDEVDIDALIEES